MRKNEAYTPDGVRVALDLNAPDLIQQADDALLIPFREWLEQNWLDTGKRGSAASAETRVKRYLERVGTLLLNDPGQYVILTDRTRRRIAQREIPLSSRIEPSAKPGCRRVYRVRQGTRERTARWKALLRACPDVRIEWRRVDTEGCFLYRGRAMRVTHPLYQGIELEADTFYPVDRIGIARCEGRPRFFTPELDELHEIAPLQHLPQSGKEETA